MPFVLSHTSSCLLHTTACNAVCWVMTVTKTPCSLTFLSETVASPHILDKTLARSWWPALPSRASMSCTSLRLSWQNQKKALEGFFGALGSFSLAGLSDFPEDEAADFLADVSEDGLVLGFTVPSLEELVATSTAGTSLADDNLSLASCACVFSRVLALV